MYAVDHEMDSDYLVFSQNVAGYHLLYNYSCGYPNLTVMLLPIGSGVNTINHHSKQASVKMAGMVQLDATWQQRVSDAALISKWDMVMILEYVALKDIE